MHRIALAIASLLTISIAPPAFADGEIVITQAKAVAGNVTPGDTAGFPITISQPGAYVLQSNLSVPGGKWGFDIRANNVDIDMNGFLLTGGGVGDYGVVTGYGESRIHGGVISQFKGSGMYIRGNAWMIDDMQIVRNGGKGIDATGASAIAVNRSLISANNQDGAITGNNGSFRDNTFSNNNAFAISCNDDCHAQGNIIARNLSGIQFVSGMILGNTISFNTNIGLYDLAGSQDTGFADNMLIGNNANGMTQTLYVLAVHPNTCVGKPC